MDVEVLVGNKLYYHHLIFDAICTTIVVLKGREESRRRYLFVFSATFVLIMNMRLFVKRIIF